MDLSDALRLAPGDMVAFVGAGGKTGCMRTILAERSSKALTFATTTTNLARDEANLAKKHFIIQSMDDLNAALAVAGNSGSALFTGPLNAEGEKWTSLPQSYIDRLAEHAGNEAGVLLVEADGARRKLLKAPAAHEPAIPSGTTLVVPVCHLAVLGEPLSNEMVHRPEKAARLLGIEEGAPVLADHIAKLLLDGEGGLKDIPEQARVRIFMNGVETQDLRKQARAIAGVLMSERRLSSVIIGALRSESPVVEVWGKTGIVVLAAGGSSRFGAPKLLEPWQGEPILRRVAQTVHASGIKPAVVVLGAEHEQLSASISDLPLQILHNPRWEHGQSTSLKVGLEALQDRCEAIIFALGDMPAIKREILQALVQAHRTTLESIIAPVAGGRLGNPVLFDTRTFDNLASLKGDRGGRALFGTYRPHTIPGDNAVLFDIDTPGDVRKDP